MRVVKKYIPGVCDKTGMNFVEMNVEDDFEFWDWHITTNTEDEFEAKRGSWTLLARDDDFYGMYVVELFKNGFPMYEDGFDSPEEIRGAVLALRQVIMKLTDEDPHWDPKRRCIGICRYISFD